MECQPGNPVAMILQIRNGCVTEDKSKGQCHRGSIAYGITLHHSASLCITLHHYTSLHSHLKGCIRYCRFGNSRDGQLDQCSSQQIPTSHHFAIAMNVTNVKVLSNFIGPTGLCELPTLSLSGSPKMTVHHITPHHTTSHHTTSHDSHGSSLTEC